MSLSLLTPFVAELEKIGRLSAPKLRRLLSGSRPLGHAEIAAVCLESTDITPEGLSLDEVYCLASWGLERLCDDDEAIEMAAVCESGRRDPSERLGIVDEVLAFECDANLMAALAEYRKDHSGSS